MNLLPLLVLLTAVSAEAAGTPCEPVDGAPGDDGVPSRPTLVRWARSHLGPEAAHLVGALDWEQVSWSGSEGRYLAPPPSQSGWSVRLAVPEPFRLSASFALEPGACLTLRQYGADPLSTEEGALALEGPWRVELRLSAGGRTKPVQLPGIPQLVVAWSREAGRPRARLIAEHPSRNFEFDLALPQGTSEHTWSTLTRPRVSKVMQELLLGLLAPGEAPSRQRQAAVTLLATEGQHFDGSAQGTLRTLLLMKRLAPRDAAALDLVARASVEGGEAALFTVDGAAPPRLWVDGQELSSHWAPRAKGFEVGTRVQGFLLVRVEWPEGEAQSFWAALGPGVRLHLRAHQGPRQESPPEGARCVVLEGSDALWSCETESLPRRGPLRCPSPSALQSARSLRSEQKGGAGASLVFVPSLPGRYTFRWHGPHIDGHWAPGCDGP
ncbi:hypothetical protein [Pyxidicoccus trucidator]|uniref:hypothetical protein n=1 Tax=Pyxidicoccus trucidator TaxID=2709662 RepID=UPI0013DBA80A|nr:hypothetical protein [Pyxidicoccus trucidator]